MNKCELVLLLRDISRKGETNNPTNECFEEKFERVCEKLQCNYDDLSKCLVNIVKHYFSDPDIPEWKFILSNIYVLSKIGEIVENSDNTEMLSVKEIKTVKCSLMEITELGINTKLQPTLPFFINRSYTETKDIFFKYNILKCTALALCEFLKNNHLRVLVLTESLRAILIALYQISFCPLKKSSESVFTEESYQRLLEEKEIGLTLLNKLRDSIYPIIYIKETMVIFQQSSPSWFKKAVSQTLTSMLLSKKGVENIALAMLDGTGNDKTKTWKALDVIYRLILSCKKLPDFRSNICKQVLWLLDQTNDDRLVFERLFVLCTKHFYFEGDMELSQDVFIRPVVNSLLHFTYREHKFVEGDFSDQIKKGIRLIYAIFVEKTMEGPSLPIEKIKPLLNVIFTIYSLTLNTVFKPTNTESKDILLKYFIDRVEDNAILFDSFLFKIQNPLAIINFRNDINLEIESQKIMLRYSDHSVTSSALESSDCLLQLVDNQTQLLVVLFRYLLRCLVNRDKYFKQVNEGLLNSENKIITEYFERKLVVYQLLSRLAENKAIQEQIGKAPKDIILFVKTVLEKTISTNLHKKTDYESEEFQTVFTVIMVLHALISNRPSQSFKKFETLVDLLGRVKDGTKHKELADLIDKIMHSIQVGIQKSTKMDIKESKTELDKALEDICDPLLPVRGHGLMVLKKLIEKKDRSVLEKKQFVLTIFQQNLKNEDSFIYLSAIDGLVAMTDIFPDIVLTILCEEYADFSRKDEDGIGVRMKLGEVLVRVTKKLGEIAPTYKSLLLNTFLNTIKDDHHIIRASSLSNLGELCRVLGYKLGTVITEVLVCVHAIIATDKAIEARRAAVTVIRQLLTGLESEMIAFLKENILPIYRTLKHIYHNDKDDVMRLQAQLALEELNENMKSFVFPRAQLNSEKKIVMLN